MTDTAIDLVRVLDYETTGFEVDDKVCQAAYCDVVNDESRWVRGGSWSTFVDPEMPMPVRAQAVHHISAEELVGAPKFDMVVPMLASRFAGTPPEAVKVFAAHNARFERQFYDFGVPMICTWRVGITIWPEAPGHKNQELRYWLGLNLDPTKCSRPHRAPDDAYVTAAILVRMLRTSGLSIAQMIDISNNPVVLPYLSFGMHALKPIEQVPTGYLEWMLKQKDMDGDARHTAFTHINLRRTA